MTRDEAVAFLARHLVTGWTLHTARRDGITAAVARLRDQGARGGGGGARHYSLERGKAHLRIGRDPADETVVPVRALVEWALARLDAEDAAWLGELVKARCASVAQWDRITRCRPRDTLPADLLAVVQAAEANQQAAGSRHRGAGPDRARPRRRAPGRAAGPVRGRCRVTGPRLDCADTAATGQPGGPHHTDGETT